MRVLLFDTKHDDGPRRWALKATDIVELIPMVRWRAIEGGAPWALGLFERHGALVPLVDLPMRLGAAPVTPRLGSRVALVSAAESTHSQSLIGLLLESTIGLDSIDFDGPAAHAGFDRRADAPLGPITIRSGVSVQLLRPSHLLTVEELGALVPSAGGGPKP